MAGLRFQAGTDVLCNFGDRGWKLGTIVALHYREPQWPAERSAPYQVLLEEDHGLIFVPEDDDRYCRKAGPDEVKIARYPDALDAVPSMLSVISSEKTAPSQRKDYRSGNCHGCHLNPGAWSCVELYSHHYRCAERNRINVSKVKVDLGVRSVGERVEVPAGKSLHVSDGFLQAPTFMRLPPGVRFADDGSLSGTVAFDPHRPPRYSVQFVAVSSARWEESEVGLVRLEISFEVEGNTPPATYNVQAFEQTQQQARSQANRILYALYDIWEEWERGERDNRDTCDVMCAHLHQLRELLEKHPRLDGGRWWVQLGGFHMNVHKLLENTLFECELYLGHALTFEDAEVRRMAELNLEGCYNKRLLEAARFMWMDGAALMMRGQWETAAELFSLASKKKDGWGWAVNFGDIWLAEAVARLVLGSVSARGDTWLEDVKGLVERCQERAEEADVFGPAGHPWAAEVLEAIEAFEVMALQGGDLTNWRDNLKERTVYWCGQILAGIPPFPPTPRPRLEQASVLKQGLPEHHEVTR